MSIRIKSALIVIAAAFTLTACSGEKNEETHDATSHTTEESSAVEHSAMDHSSDGHIPEGLKEATNPTFAVGSKVIIQADHMEGMKDAEATIVGAFETVVYTVSYTPANGGNPVTDHKWVIHEELEGIGDEPLKPGDQATINADHMQGMSGVSATIDSAEETIVYMIDYISTTGENVTNHKWVTDSELKAVE